MAGSLRPASDHLLSEPAIVARLAKAVLANRSSVDWDSLLADYGRIREHIEHVVPDFENYNERARQPGGFYLPNPIRKREFKTKDGRAQFTVHPCRRLSCKRPVPDDDDPQSRSFNTTIYGLDDRYRGIHNGRRVVFLNADDIRWWFSSGQVVDLISKYDGEERIARSFRWCRTIFRDGAPRPISRRRMFWCR
jgi:hypothetical protein